MQNKNIDLIRFSILKNCFQTKEGHVASAFSILEILYIIFKKHIKKNFFILSKGHASIGMYAVMYFFKYISKKTFYSFCSLNSKLGGHPDSTSYICQTQLSLLHNVFSIFFFNHTDTSHLPLLAEAAKRRATRTTPKNCKGRHLRIANQTTTEPLELLVQ